MSDTLLPLDGVTVVALEHAVAAPLATRHLCDLGARVLKLERIGEGDFARNYDDAVRGLASHFVWLNRGKESVALDLKSAEGVAIARRLLETADVFVQNLAPGAVSRLRTRPRRPDRRQPSPRGREHLRLRRRWPDAGPQGVRPAHPGRVRAHLDHRNPASGNEDGVPSADIAAAPYTTQAVLAALVRRSRTGAGGVIATSMFDATLEWLGHPMYMQMYSGKQVPRMSLSHASIAPYNAYPTSDGQILIGVQNDRGWRALVCDVFDRPDLADIPNLLTNPLRVAHRSECDAFVAEHTRHFTTAEIDARLAAAGIPAAQINDMAAVVEHVQIASRDRWRTIETPSGTVQAMLPTIFHDVELKMGNIPALGQHSREILHELGYGQKQVDRLVMKGVVGTDAATPPSSSSELQLFS